MVNIPHANVIFFSIACMRSSCDTYVDSILIGVIITCNEILKTFSPTSPNRATIVYHFQPSLLIIPHSQLYLTHKHKKKWKKNERIIVTSVQLSNEQWRKIISFNQSNLPSWQPLYLAHIYKPQSEFHTNITMILHPKYVIKVIVFRWWRCS